MQFLTLINWLKSWELVAKAPVFFSFLESSLHSVLLESAHRMWIIFLLLLKLEPSVSAGGDCQKGLRELWERVDSVTKEYKEHVKSIRDKEYKLHPLYSAPYRIITKHLMAAYG